MDACARVPHVFCMGDERGKGITEGKDLFVKAIVFFVLSVS